MAKNYKTETSKQRKKKERKNKQINKQTNKTTATVTTTTTTTNLSHVLNNGSVKTFLTFFAKARSAFYFSNAF